MQALTKFLKSFHFLTLALFGCLGLVFFTSLPNRDGSASIRSARASITAPERSPLNPPIPEDFSELAREGYTEYHGTLVGGETLAGSFRKFGVPPTAREQFIKAFESKIDFTSLRPGDKYWMILDENGGIVKSVYRVNPLTSYTAQPDHSGKLQAQRDEVLLEVRTVAISGEIGSSLFAAFPSDIQTPKLVYAFADILKSSKR